MTFGEKVKKIREEKKMSQRLLGEKLGVTQQTVAQYEKIEDSPKLATVRKIAEALDVPLSDLIEVWSIFTQSEIIRDMADEDNECFWTQYLDDKLKQIGCRLAHDEDNYQTWIEFPDGALEVTDAQLKELDNSLVEYLNFKLSEMRKKYPRDFRHLTRAGIKLQSTSERLNPTTHDKNHNE